MDYLFANWDAVMKTLQRAPHRLLLFDYDGTLAELKPTPKQAHLQPVVRRLLSELACRKTCSVGIISGRSLKQIRKRVGLPGIAYVGNHGLESQNGNGRWSHPVAVERQEALHRFVPHLRKSLLGIPGVMIEDKGMTLSVHFRRVISYLKPQVRRIVQHVLKARGLTGQFRMLAGNQVIEIRPSIPWGKGNAVESLRMHHPKNTVILYAGDDATDEEAFRAAKSRGIAVRIGANRGSKAPYYLRNQREVKSLLGRLVHL